MYCPKCATQNTDEASFCRNCGANVSLVPQALTGQLAGAAGGGEEVWHGRRGKVPSIERSVTPFFGGLGFFLVAIAVMLFMPGGSGWGFWMFIPAFFMMGSGAAEYLKLRQYQKSLPRAAAGGFNPPPSAIPPAQTSGGALPPREQPATSYAPGTVTEGTTKLLERDE